MQNRNYKGLLHVLKDAQLISKKKKGKCKLIDIFFSHQIGKSLSVPTSSVGEWVEYRLSLTLLVRLQMGKVTLENNLAICIKI